VVKRIKAEAVPPDMAKAEKPDGKAKKNGARQAA
jgi:hypothetical protein